MKLSDDSLAWLRDLHSRALAGEECSESDAIDASLAMGLMAHTAPAWVEPYVGVLDQLIGCLTAGADGQKPDHGTTEKQLLALVGLRSMIETSTDPRRASGRTSLELTPGSETHTQFTELLAPSAGEASRMAEAAAGPDARGRLLAAPLASCPQVVDVDFPMMAFDQAEWIGGNLHLGLAPRVEDSTRSTSFRLVGAEPRMWDVHGVENARIESRMSGLNVRVPLVRCSMQLIRSSY